LHLLRRLLVQELLRVQGQGQGLLRVQGLQPVPVRVLLQVQVLLRVLLLPSLLHLRRMPYHLL
jgi:hypothetical protein